MYQHRQKRGFEPSNERRRGEEEEVEEVDEDEEKKKATRHNQQREQTTSDKHSARRTRTAGVLWVPLQNARISGHRLLKALL